LGRAGNELVIASRQVPGSVNEEDARFWRLRKWAMRAMNSAHRVPDHRDRAQLRRDAFQDLAGRQAPFDVPVVRAASRWV